MPTRRRFVGLAVVMAFAVIATAARAKGPFSCGPFMLSEEVSESADIALAEWIAGEPPKTVLVKRPSYSYAQESPGSATFRIVRTPDGAKEFLVGDEIALDHYVAGNKGERFLLVRSTAGNPPKIEWLSGGALSDAGFDYLVHLPAREAPAGTRIAYHVRFLEHEDPSVAADAHFSLEQLSPDDLAKSADKLPRAKLREWAAAKDPRTDRRLEQYGILLGFCGDASDAELLRKRIVEGRPDAELDVRPAIAGVKAGYLLLAGETGLENLEREDFVDRNAPFSETYSTMRAIRFMADHGGGKIDKERLCESMRLLLDRPDLVDLVIHDLAR